MTYSDAKMIAMRQSAVDLNCEAEDFISDKNKVVLSKLNKGRKRYITETSFCNLVCYGNACVASVDVNIKDFMECFMQKYDGRYCLEQYLILDEEFKKYGKNIWKSESFIPDIRRLVIVSPDFDVNIYAEDEICQFYRDKRFSNALGYKEYEAERRDVIAAVGRSADGQIMGIAGASNDSDTMWQVGIDVMPEFRGKGVATALLNILTAEILKKNIVPFYTTPWSHVASKGVAVSSGYKPAWVNLAWW